MHIKTNQLLLRPLAIADADAIAEVVFSDPDVVAMLAHNTRLKEDAQLEAKRWTSVMGIDGDNSIWEDGGMGLFAVTPKKQEHEFAGVAGFYMKQNADQLWDGEYFYALGSTWHGKRFMSEVADAFRQKLMSMPNLGTIYACYWDMTNEASGRILQKTGFTPEGRRLLLDEYDEERCQSMFEYDLWRIQNATSQEKRASIAFHAARRAGAFVAENVLERENTINQIIRIYGSLELPKSAVDIFRKAISTPGMANLEFRGK